MCLHLFFAYNVDVVLNWDKRFVLVLDYLAKAWCISLLWASLPFITHVTKPHHRMLIFPPFWTIFVQGYLSIIKCYRSVCRQSKCLYISSSWIEIKILKQQRYFKTIVFYPIQFCDFYAATLSLWVTIVALSPGLSHGVHQLLNFSGVLVVAVLVQYNRTSLHVFAVPLALGLTVLLASVIVR